MPPELLSLCKPLHCELCGVQATSPIQVKMHYEGKTHDKHVRNFFANWEDNIGQIVPQKFPEFDPKRMKCGQEDHIGNHEPLHCYTCDLYFTSVAQLEQHKAGRNHQRLSVGLTPMKPGYYNKETLKWQRQPVNEEEPPQCDLILQSPPSDRDPVANKFWCDLCKVGAPSQTQIDMHLNGKSHKSRMKRSMGGVANDDLQAIQKRVQLKDSIFKLSNKVVSIPSHTRRKGPDLSVYRTPSGQYYCAACNISLNSEPQFAQHQVSKNHKKKESVMKNKK